MDLSFEKNIASLEEEITKKIENLKKENKDFLNDKSIINLKNKLKQEIEKTYQNLSDWNIVEIARLLNRPQFFDYRDSIFHNFIEIHGDKLFSDNKTLTGGFATIEDEKVVIIGQQRGTNINDAVKIYKRGMTTPNGYRKALRIMKLAEKFNLPIITFIDTPGADPSITGEKEGQGNAIAVNLREMSGLKVPIISIVIGEGGSGGALALGVANHVMMLEYSIYSVISPEGAAAILFHDGKKAPQAAKSLNITSQKLLKLSLIDHVIPEPLGGAHRNHKEASNNVKQAILTSLKELKKIPPQKMADKRLDKLMKYGVYISH